jgi:Ca-activated chloride channel family protein
MRFAAPEMLWLLALLPPLALAGWWVALRRKRALIAFAGGADRLGGFRAQVSRHRRATKLLLLYVALAALALALARPQWGTRLEPIERKGADIAIVLDTSLSMATEDLAPNRLEQAKHAIGSLLERVPGDRVALITFAGQASVSCPLTVDHGALRLFLDAVDVRSVPLGGTALAGALAAAVRTLNADEQITDHGRAVVLYTDGEDHEGGLEAALAGLRDEGIPVFVVGTGTTRGAPIPLREAGMLTGYKKDREGKVVTSSLAEEILEQIATETDGRYYRATSGEVEVERLAQTIDALKEGELGPELRARYQERFQWPLTVVALALFAEARLGDRRRPRADEDAA